MRITYVYKFLGTTGYEHAYTYPNRNDPQPLHDLLLNLIKAKIQLMKAPLFFLLILISSCTNDLDFPPVQPLFKTVRDTLKSEWTRSGNVYLLEPRGHSPRGLFVRFTKEGRERGCLALINGVDDWEKSAQFAAWDGAFRDPRYPPITSDEAPNLDIEITMMGPLAPMKHPQDFDPQNHAVYMVHPRTSVILQPSISRENKWSPIETLEALCRKGQLNQGAWNDPGVIFYKAETKTFQEPFLSKK